MRGEREFSNPLSWREDRLIYGCLESAFDADILTHMPKIATLTTSIFELGFEVVRLRGIGNTCWPTHGLAQNRVDSFGPHGHHACVTTPLSLGHGARKGDLGSQLQGPGPFSAAQVPQFPVAKSLQLHGFRSGAVAKHRVGYLVQYLGIMVRS